MGLWFVNGHAVLRILGSGPGDHAECRPSHTYTHKTRFELRVGRLSLQDVWERFKCKLIAGCENTRVTKDQPAHLRGMKDRVCILLFSGGCEPPHIPLLLAFLRYYYKTGILERVDRRLVYKFGKNAHGWQEDKL